MNSNSPVFTSNGRAAVTAEGKASKTFKTALLLLSTSVLLVLTLLHLHTAFGQISRRVMGHATDVGTWEWDHETLTGGGIFGEL